MKVFLALSVLFLSSVTNGKSVLDSNEIGLPQIKKLDFSLKDIASEENLEQFTRLLSNFNQHNVTEGISSLSIDVDDFLDGLLTNLKAIIISNGMDPMALEGSVLNLFPIGTITLANGWLQDTSSIERYDNVVVTYTAKKISFLLPLSFKALLFTYKYTTKILLLTITGDVQGKIDDVKLDLEIGYDISNKTLYLGALNLKNSGKITVKFTGNGLVDWITNAMTSVITTVLYPVLIRIVEAFVKSAAGDLIDAVNAFIHG